VALDGGAEGTLLKIVRGLPPDRYRASIATFASPDGGRFLHRFGCPVHVLPLDRTYGWQAFRAAVFLNRLIRTSHVSIVHTFFETSDLWGGLIARLSRCPVLVSSRRDMGIQRSFKHDAAYRLLHSMFDQVQTVSDAVRDFAIRHDHLDPRKVVTLHNGVDLERVAAARVPADLRSRLGLEEASHVIVDTGWIRRVKGADTLVQAAAHVCREFPNAMFVIVGDNDELDYIAELRTLVARLGLQRNVRFPGPFDDVLPILKMCDVFCHLSRSDGLSNSLLEAMACGLPCVATATGGNPEAVADGISGFLVPVDCPEIAAARILELLRNPSRAGEMGQNGHEIVQRRFSSDSMVGRLVELYEGALRNATSY
jgi:glycosyltransferase involved in cell wall biosynthesis